MVAKGYYYERIRVETRKQDQRISGLEEKVEGIGKMLAEFINEFKK